MRQHHAHGVAVDDAEMGGERIGGGMGRAEHAVLDGRPRPGGAQQHPAARFEVGGRGKDAGQGGDGEPEGFAREDQRQGGAAFCDQGLQGMSQCVNAAASRDSRRLGKGQRGIKQGNARGQGPLFC